MGSQLGALEFTPSTLLRPGVVQTPMEVRMRREAPPEKVGLCSHFIYISRLSQYAHFDLFSLGPLLTNATSSL